MKEIIKPYVRLGIYELACKISETYPEGFVVKIDNEEDFLMIQYLLRSDTLVGAENSDEMDYDYWLEASGNKCLYLKCLSTSPIYITDFENELKNNKESLFNSFYEDVAHFRQFYQDCPLLSSQEAIAFLKSLHGVPMSKQQKQKLLDIINKI